MKKLYRSKKNRIIGGLMGGIGEYFNIDPIIIRIVFLFGLFATEIIPGILIYVLGLLLVPNHPDIEIVKEASSDATSTQ